jgi:hypothetical protein
MRKDRIKPSTPETAKATYPPLTRLFRVFAMMGNGLLTLMPIFYLISDRRPDLSVFLISACCLVLAGCSELALVFRTQKKPYYFGAIFLNALVVMLFIYLAISIRMSGLRDSVAMFLLIMPALLNLVAVIMVRRSQVSIVNSPA